MRFINKLNLIILLSLLLENNMSAQSINLYTLNNGGGSNSTMEWSIGESVSIAYFTTASYSLNTGVLQPLIGNVASIPSGPAVFGNQIPVYLGKRITKRYVWSHFKESTQIKNLFSDIENRFLDYSSNFEHSYKKHLSV